jgi:predicted acyltransferase
MADKATDSSSQLTDSEGVNTAESASVDSKSVSYSRGLPERDDPTHASKTASEPRHRLRSIDAVRGAAALTVLAAILIRPADYIPSQLRTAAPLGFSLADLAPAVLLFLSGTSAALNTTDGRRQLRLRRGAIFLILASGFWDLSLNHLMPIGQFFLAAFAAYATATAGVSWSLRLRAALLIGLFGLHALVLAVLPQYLGQQCSLLVGAIELGLGGAIAGSLHLSKPFWRFLVDSAALGAIALASSSFYYRGIPVPARATLLNPTYLAPGFTIAALGLSLGIWMAASILIDRLKLYLPFSFFIGIGENAFAFWFVPFLAHVAFFTRFTVQTLAGEVSMRDRMFDNLMDMWNQQAANTIYAAMVVFIGVVVASSLNERRVHFRV